MKNLNNLGECLRAAGRSGEAVTRHEECLKLRRDTFGPADPATLAKQLRRVLDSNALQTELRAAGHARAATFSWDRAARQFGELVEAHFR
jgi:glycosyltransferase involved in cell wall biosynthesis